MAPRWDSLKVNLEQELAANCREYDTSCIFDEWGIVIRDGVPQAVEVFFARYDPFARSGVPDTGGRPRLAEFVRQERDLGAQPARFFEGEISIGKAVIDGNAELATILKMLKRQANTFERKTVSETERVGSFTAHFCDYRVRVRFAPNGSLAKVEFWPKRNE